MEEGGQSEKVAKPGSPVERGVAGSIEGVDRHSRVNHLLQESNIAPLGGLVHRIVNRLSILANYYKMKEKKKIEIQ